MAKLRINGDSSGYVDLEAPNAASSSTLDLDQVPQKNAANTFSADMSFGDNNKVNLGAGNDLQLYHDGSNNYIKSAAAGWLNVPLSGNGMTVADSNFSNIFFKIDSSGRVTKPKQPAWSGGLSGSQSGLITSYIVRLNNGNHFSNGVFTCPVAGNYFISFFAMTSSAGAMDVELRINGSTNNGLVPYSSSAGFHTSAGGTTVLYLNANDTIQMHNNNTQLYGNSTGRHTGFSGYLIG